MAGKDYVQMGRDFVARRERRAAYEASYRATLRRAFLLAGQGGELSPEECSQVLSDIQALTDTLGIKLAETIRCEEKARWLADTGRCPYCGELAHEVP
jgi:hypothetical protein